MNCTRCTHGGYEHAAPANEAAAAASSLFERDYVKINDSIAPSGPHVVVRSPSLLAVRTP
jgi:hypothetical protein